MEISLEIGRKYENCYISEMQTIQWSEISRNPGMKNEEKFPVRTFRVVLFPEMQTSICGRMESSLMRNSDLWESLSGKF